MKAFELLKQQPIPEAKNVYDLKWKLGVMVGKLLEKGEITVQETTETTAPMRECKTIEEVTRMIWGDDDGAV